MSLPAGNDVGSAHIFCSGRLRSGGWLAKHRCCTNYAPGLPLRAMSVTAWVLKTLCGVFHGQECICKWLNCGSTRRLKFAEITALVPFSTATPVFASYPELWLGARKPRRCA